MSFHAAPCGRLQAGCAAFFVSRFVVLLSGVVDALQSHPDGVRFYVGHELAHPRRDHAVGDLLRLPRAVAAAGWRRHPRHR